MSLDSSSLSAFIAPSSAMTSAAWSGLRPLARPLIFSANWSHWAAVARRGAPGPAPLMMPIGPVSPSGLRPAGTKASIFLSCRAIEPSSDFLSPSSRSPRCIGSFVVENISSRVGMCPSQVRYDVRMITSGVSGLLGLRGLRLVEVHEILVGDILGELAEACRLGCQVGLCCRVALGAGYGDHGTARDRSRLEHCHLCLQ